jgi:DNA repair exonuclease SbcCD ATPase subunit
MKKLVPWIGYCGSLCQNTYAEDLEHGYLVWDIDIDKHRHDVEFIKLPNPRPFVTIEWAGDVDSTYQSALMWPSMSRFRIKSTYALPTSDATALSSKLRKEKQASEVVFKTNDEELAKKYASASLGVNVNSFETIEQMLHEYYSNESLDQTTWKNMSDFLKVAHSKVVAEDDIARGTVWTISRLEFDNLYGYGSGNTIDFENKNGIIGIFGPNAIGKSSVVGSMMYTLFNASDRDVGKNAHVINSKKKFGSGRAVIKAAGSSYEIERKSEKVVSRGLLTANTSLTFKQLDEECVDLTGDLRPDTEKNIRKVIGSHEDFMYTCGSVQDDVSRFLREGPTQRKAILSRFLGIDMFEKLYSLLNGELSEVKNKLKIIQTKDVLLDLAKTLQAEHDKTKHDILIYESKKKTVDVDRSEAYVELQKITSLVEARNKAIQNNHLVEHYTKQSKELTSDIQFLNEKLEESQLALNNAKAKLEECLSWDEIDVRRKQIHDAKLTLGKFSSIVDSKTKEIERSKKIILKLQDVPCGDQFRTCVYIKDAHEEKSKIHNLEKELNELIKQHSEQTKAVLALGEDDLDKVKNKKIRYQDEIDSYESSIRKEKLKLESKKIELDKLKEKIEKCSIVSLDDNDIEQQHITATQIYKKLTDELASIEMQLKTLSNNLGKCEANLAKINDDLKLRLELEYQSRIRELLVNAFSRRGIPNIVLGRLLPVLNEEMNKILDGVTSFNVVLVTDDATNALDISIDDGTTNGLRPLELGSGMERTIASIALRVALSNLTTLPKTDFMIIDEGFGSLDPVNAVSCVSLLRSLKKWFRFVLVVSHVDIIKDAVDNIIEVQKTDDGAKIQV